MSELQRSRERAAAREQTARATAKAAVPIVARKYDHDDDGKEDLRREYPAPVAAASSPPAQATVVVQPVSAAGAPTTRASVTTHARFPAPVAAAASPPVKTTFDLQPVASAAGTVPGTAIAATAAPVLVSRGTGARVPTRVPTTTGPSRASAANLAARDAAIDDEALISDLAARPRADARLTPAAFAADLRSTRKSLHSPRLTAADKQLLKQKEAWRQATLHRSDIVSQTLALRPPCPLRHDAAAFRAALSRGRSALLPPPAPRLSRVV
jgi:hypothetical protein